MLSLLQHGYRHLSTFPSRSPTSSGPAILKLNPPRHPYLVENEDFFLSMAADCGIPVPAHRLVRDREGRTGLLVGRFDREQEGVHVRRLPQEDACQVLGRYPAAKYTLKLEDVIVGLGDAVAAQDGSRPLAVRRILETAAFSYLIGNGDLHGKNLSIRCAPSGLCEVTPAYDLLTTQPYSGWRDPMALRLYGRDNKLALHWWLEAAAHLGLTERAAVRSLARIAESAESWPARVHEIGFDDSTTDRLGRVDPDATRRAAGRGRSAVVREVRVGVSGGLQRTLTDIDCGADLQVYGLSVWVV